jgi:hypothetical protein
MDEPATAGLVGRWVCNEGEGGTVTDSSGKGSRNAKRPRMGPRPHRQRARFQPRRPRHLRRLGNAGRRRDDARLGRLHSIEPAKAVIMVLDDPRGPRSPRVQGRPALRLEMGRSHALRRRGAAGRVAPVRLPTGRPTSSSTACSGQLATLPHGNGRRLELGSGSAQGIPVPAVSTGGFWMRSDLLPRADGIPGPIAGPPPPLDQTSFRST